MFKLAAIILAFAYIAKCSVISSYFESIDNNDLIPSTASSPNSVVLKIKSKFDCALICNRDPNCTVAVHTKTASECLIYTILRPLISSDLTSNLAKMILRKKRKKKKTFLFYFLFYFENFLFQFKFQA